MKRVFSVIKRTMGEEVRSVRIRGQNNEMRFRLMAYNAARLASLAYLWSEGFYGANKDAGLNNRSKMLECFRFGSCSQKPVEGTIAGRRCSYPVRAHDSGTCPSLPFNELHHHLPLL